MADTKHSAEFSGNEITAFGSTDYVHILRDPSGTPDNKYAAVQMLQEAYVIPIGSVADDMATGTAVNFFEFPYDFTMTDIKAGVGTAPVGSSAIFDVNLVGTGTIMTTDKLEIEASDKSTDDAATQPALTTTDFAEGDQLSFDIDQVGSSTAGKAPWVIIYGYRG